MKTQEKTDRKLSAAELCAITGRTDAWHRALSRRGWIAPKIKGRWQEKATLQGLFRYYQDREGTRALRDVQLEREKEKLRSEKVRADEAEHRVMPIADFESVVALMSNAIRTRLMAIPSSVSPYLVGLTSVAEIDARLRGTITDALRELSQPVSSTATPRKQKRRK